MQLNQNDVCLHKIVEYFPWYLLHPKQVSTDMLQSSYLTLKRISGAQGHDACGSGAKYHFMLIVNLVAIIQ